MGTNALQIEEMPENNFSRFYDGIRLKKLLERILPNLDSRTKKIQMVLEAFSLQ